MKLIVEVNKEDLDFIRKTFTQNSHDYIPKVIRNRFTDAVLNGTPIPDNATNGNSVIKIFSKGIVRISPRKNVSVEFNKNWWNALYKAESEE